jgi:hypothetical protein
MQYDCPDEPTHADRSNDPIAGTARLWIKFRACNPSTRFDRTAAWFRMAEKLHRFLSILPQRARVRRKIPARGEQDDLTPGFFRFGTRIVRSDPGAMSRIVC